MPDGLENLAEKSGHFIRDFASHQGEAYRKYGEVLARYGDGKLGAVEVVKTAADVYFTEVGRFASSIAELSASVSELVLSAGGIRVIKDKKTDTKAARSKSASTAV